MNLSKIAIRAGVYILFILVYVPVVSRCTFSIINALKIFHFILKW